jgi:hypothetical protein
VVESDEWKEDIQQWKKYIRIVGVVLIAGGDSYNWYVMTKGLEVGMGEPGFGPLCMGLKEAYRLLSEAARDHSRAEGQAQRSAAGARMREVRERICRCEMLLLVVSLGQKVACDGAAGCSVEAAATTGEKCAAPSP